MPPRLLTSFVSWTLAEPRGRDEHVGVDRLRGAFLDEDEALASRQGAKV